MEANILAYAQASDNIATEPIFCSINMGDEKNDSHKGSMKRSGKPDEIAGSMAGCNVSFTTGNDITIDGHIIFL